MTVDQNSHQKKSISFGMDPISPQSMEERELSAYKTPLSDSQKMISVAFEEVPKGESNI